MSFTALWYWTFFCANVCRHFTSEVLSHVWFTASWYRSFWAIYVGFSIIKWNNMCHARHHGTALFWAIYVGFSILKWNNPCHTQRLLHTNAFTRRCFYTHTHFHTQTLLHTDAFTHRGFYTQMLLHTHTLSYTEAFTYRSFWRVSLYDILWSWTQTVLFLTSSTWWHRALLQTFADISLVKYCHMCDLQHHGTDLFGPFMLDFP